VRVGRARGHDWDEKKNPEKEPQFEERSDSIQEVCPAPALATTG